MTDTFTKSTDCDAWLKEMKSRILSARLSAARSINRELILLYWDRGTTVARTGTGICPYGQWDRD